MERWWCGGWLFRIKCINFNELIEILNSAILIYIKMMLNYRNGLVANVCVCVCIKQPVIPSLQTV